MFKFRLSLLLGLALAATSLLRADFTGAYAVGTPGSYNLVSGATTASAVPEPSSCAALAGTAFLGLALTRRRQA